MRRKGVIESVVFNCRGDIACDGADLLIVSERVRRFQIGMIQFPNTDCACQLAFLIINACREIFVLAAISTLT